MNVLGLDLSLTSTGFYLIRDSDGTESNTKNDIFFEIRTKPEDFKSDIERSDYIASRIVNNIRGIRIDLIALEDYFTGKMPQSVIKLATLGTIVRVRLLEAGYSYMPFITSQIKKFETGKGVAPKDTMVKSVFKKHNLDTNSNNIADACAIAHIGMGYLEWMSGKRDFNKAEKEVLEKISKERVPILPYSLNLSSSSEVIK